MTTDKPKRKSKIELAREKAEAKKREREAAAAEEADEQTDDVVEGEIEIPALAQTLLTPSHYANNRPQPNVQADELPDPEDVGEKTGPLDHDETWLFGRCEQALGEYFVAEHVGLKALLNIQQRKLYREQFPTFEEYAQDRFDKGRQWVYRQLDRYEISKIVAPAGTKLLPEGHTRYLAPVLHEAGADAVRKVWVEALTEVGVAVDTEAEPPSNVVTGVVLRRVRQRLYPAKNGPKPTVPRPRKPSAKPVAQLREAIDDVHEQLDLSKLADEARNDPDGVRQEWAQCVAAWKQLEDTVSRILD